MFKVFLLFFLRFISHSFLFFVFPSMKRVFLAFLVHKTVCNLPSKDFHMQTVRGEGRGSAGGEFPSTLSSCRDWCVIIFMLLKKHFQCVIIKKEQQQQHEEEQLQLVRLLLHLSSASPFPCPLFCLSLSVFFARRGPPWLLSAAIWMSKINGQTFTFLYFSSLLFLLLLLLLLC